MAGKGRVPSDPELRRRRNRPPELDYLPAGPVTKTAALALPSFYEVEGFDGQMERVEYTAAAREWWQSMISSPMAARWLDTDIQYLRALVILVDRYFRKPTPLLFAELRRGAASLGATWADRQHLKVRAMLPDTPAATPPPAPSGKVAVMDRYRQATESGAA